MYFSVWKGVVLPTVETKIPLMPRPSIPNIVPPFHSRFILDRPSPAVGSLTEHHHDRLAGSVQNCRPRTPNTKLDGIKKTSRTAVLHIMFVRGSSTTTSTSRVQFFFN